MGSVGFTTSIPIEILLAAGKTPVDLNNRFISDPEASRRVREAEHHGFPSTCCAWMKGIYGTLPGLDVEEVIAVVRGDCSQTQALMEILQMEGVSVYPFAYPYDRSRASMEAELHKLMEHYGAAPEAVEGVKRRLDRVRSRLNRLDRLTWREGRVSGEENHAFLVSSSDMRGDPEAFEEEIDAFLAEAEGRTSAVEAGEVRLGFLGVPPVWSDLYPRLERPGSRVVYNEIQRQFSMPYLEKDLTDQYLRFTYPYDIFYRLGDIQREAVRRRIDGFVHYAQAFCFRQMEDKVFRHYLDQPILTLEGDRPEPMDERTGVRVDAFLEMLRREKASAPPAAEGN